MIKVKLLLVFLLFCCNTKHLNAQTINLGLNGGINFNYSHHHISSDLLNSTSSDLTQPLFNFGIEANFPLKHLWSFQTEILYNDRGTQKGKSDNGTKSKLEWSYIIFPQFLRLSLPLKRDSKTTFYCEVGAYFGYSLKHEFIGYSPYTIHEAALPTNYGKFDWGLGGGFGFHHSIGYGRLGMGAELISDILIPPYLKVTTSLPQSSVSIEKYYFLINSIDVSYSYPINKLLFFTNVRKSKKA